ncbi:MAG TPA: AGE family epimerase/isomerase [Rhizomicrobium sp.]|jgi:mannose-1-phosphate guanylyltransferase/mannose-6-phosphate isomerase|nr:AGE family epimerase/isomerase [Rhizomicrobium sp.]
MGTAESCERRPVQVCPIILCGGEGSRLWPVSRRDFPKQFAPLVGELSCFQQAALRLHGMAGAVRPVVVAGEAHETTVCRQLEAIGVEAVVILEPEGRDSGPATAAAAAWLLASGLDGAAIMQPADHYIPDVERFRAAATLAAAGAEHGFIVTFGIAPTGPETSYGYIHRAGAVDGCTGVSAVHRFIEKPSRERAREYLAQGYVWNSGMFAFRPSVLLDEFRSFEPSIADAVERAVANAEGERVIRLDPVAFGQSPKKSLDHAVMERTARAAVVDGDFPWSDLGAWTAIYHAHAKDGQGNVVSGEAIVLESERCFVRAEGTPLAVIGLSGVGVIAEPDGIVVCNLDAAGSVKLAVDALRTKARPESLRRSRGATRRAFANLSGAAERLGRWLDNSALPLWWTAGADHEQGGYFELLDENARPVRTSRRIRVQARQIYSYAAAGLGGWLGPSRSAVAHGLSFLAKHYRRGDGLYRTLVDDAGHAVDERTFLYDQAFVLLALASAAKAGIEKRRCTADALELRTILVDRFARKNGAGFLEQELRGSKFQSNPHMHLLEAALEWSSVDPEQAWDSLADSIVALSLKCFIDRDSGILREFFDEAGTPLPGIPGLIIEPGHQFEWAWLLSRWATARNDAAALGAARTLFETGERHGIDHVRGVAIDTLLADMSPHSRQARLWPQTERLKAALALAARAQDGETRQRSERAALSAAEGLAHYFDTTVAGLWHDKMRADGTFVTEPSPGSSLYHIVCGIQNLREYAG